MTKADCKKATACSGNYQDIVTTPLARDHDDDAAIDEDPDEGVILWDDDDILSAVDRVSLA
jgi:hypothetical protein